MPIVGHMMFAALMSGRQRVLVLTDSRLLVLATSRAALDVRGRGVRGDVPVHALRVAAAGKGKFRLGWSQGGRDAVFQIAGRSRPGFRLAEALRMLAGDGGVQDMVA